jgi:predicted HTH domain antitoxin
MNDARSNTDEATIKAAVSLMRKGHATLAETADLFGRSRQIVRHWAQRAGLDVAAARAAYLEHEKAKELARV